MGNQYELERENIWSSREWREFQRMAKNRARAKAAARAVGLDFRLLEEVIHDVIRDAGPDLRRLFNVDLPAKINEAIVDIKRQGARGLFKTAKTGQGCGGPKSFGYDWEGKTRRFCSHE